MINQFLDLSTKYMTREDSKKLAVAEIEGVEFSKPRVIPHEYGWFVNVQPDQEIFDEHVESLKKLGFSAAFIDVLTFARKHECWWINFDQDGEDEEGLPTFEW